MLQSIFSIAEMLFQPLSTKKQFKTTYVCNCFVVRFRHFTKSAVKHVIFLESVSLLVTQATWQMSAKWFIRIWVMWEIEIDRVQVRAFQFALYLTKNILPLIYKSTNGHFLLDDVCGKKLITFSIIISKKKC